VDTLRHELGCGGDPGGCDCCKILLLLLGYERTSRRIAFLRLKCIIVSWEPGGVVTLPPSLGIVSMIYILSFFCVSSVAAAAPGASSTLRCVTASSFDVLWTVGSLDEKGSKSRTSTCSFGCRGTSAEGESLA